MLIHTLLNNCFSCNVGDWKHGIKYVTKGERKRQRMVVTHTSEITATNTALYLTYSC